MSFNENMILHIHRVMTGIAGYELSGQYKKEDNPIMEIDENGRRKIRFTPVAAAETEDAMQQLILAYMDVSPSTVEAVLGKMVKIGSIVKIGQSRATKYVNAKYIRKNED